VKTTLTSLLESIPPSERDAAGRSLDRVEILLEWMADHPTLPEVRTEAARLLGEYRRPAG
jgi:hypothetical protein